MKRLAGFFLVAVMGLSLAACETSEKIYDVISDPDIQVGAAEVQSTKVSLQAYAAADVNKNFEGEPSPVVVRVLALSSDHRVFSYDYFSLTDSMEKTLGSTLKADLGETMIKPDSYQVLGPYEVPEGTKKIAVIAEYLDLESAVWRTSVSVRDLGDNDQFLLLLLDEEVRLVKQEG